MRTHIRMHFDKKTNEFNEENYITCILEEDGIEIPPAGGQNAAAVAAAAAALASTNHTFLAQEAGAGVGVAADGSRTSPPSAGNGGPAVRHHCELCSYSTSDRGHMVSVNEVKKEDQDRSNLVPNCVFAGQTYQTSSRRRTTLTWSEF